MYIVRKPRTRYNEGIRSSENHVQIQAVICRKAGIRMRLMKKIAAIGLTAALAAGMTVSGYAAGWENGPAGWMYELANGDMAQNAWEYINGAWYYFNENGIMLENGITPDGYTVGANGAWIADIAQQAQQAAAEAGITEETVMQAASDAAQMVQEAMDQAGITQADIDAAAAQGQELLGQAQEAAANLTEEDVNQALQAAQEAASSLTEEDVNKLVNEGVAQAQQAAAQAGITEEQINQGIADAASAAQQAMEQAGVTESDIMSALSSAASLLGF